MLTLASAAVARASEFVQAQDLRAAIDGESLIELSSPTPAALGDVDTLVLTAKDTSDVAMDPSTVVTRAVAGALGRDVERDAPLMEEGLDSLSAVSSETSTDGDGIEMPATLVFDYPSRDAIIEYLDGAISKHRTQSRTTEKRSEVTKRMAIVGDADNRGSEVAQRTFKLETCEARGLVLNALRISWDVCDIISLWTGLQSAVDGHQYQARFRCHILVRTSLHNPDCRFHWLFADPRKTMWTHLQSLIDAESSPLGRFALDATADSPPSEIVNRMMHTMENVELFDASAFRISPAESEAMDPQQRILLESVLHARRGIDGRDLIHRSGVVVGASGSST